MAVITYNISNFNSRKAENKELVAMVASDVMPPTINSNDSNFRGTGICMTTSGHRYRIVIAGAVYDFDANGNCTTEADLKLMMAVANITVPTEGSVVESSSKTTYTRGDDGYEPSPQPGEALGNILIDSLKPRDQFAVQALRGILARIDHPEALSKTEMNYYCNAAYQWAANMMKVAADSRERIEDVRTAESGGQVAIQGDDLESNTEKLLNNLIVELASTNATLGSGSTAVKAERVSLPEIKALMEAYVAGAGSTTVGLQDLIDAINNISSGSSGGTIQIGDEGLGRDTSHPLFICSTGGAEGSNHVIYQYRSKGEAESDGWTFNSTDGVWKKLYYNDVHGEYTDESAKALPTWKYVAKVSVVEMPELIEAINNLTSAISGQ